MTNKRLSKSQFMTGLQCLKRLWLYFFLAAFSLAFAACSPGDRGWCRGAGDYSPLPSGPGTGRLAVAPGRVEAAAPEGFDKAAAEKLITELFIKDLSYPGGFVVAAYADGGNAAVLSPELTNITVMRENGRSRLLEAELNIKLSKNGKVLLEKTYRQSWRAADAPGYEEAWREVLPRAMLEMRKDIIAALSR